MSSTVLDALGLNNRCGYILHYSLVTTTFKLKLKVFTHMQEKLLIFLIECQQHKVAHSHFFQFLSESRGLNMNSNRSNRSDSEAISDLQCERSRAPVNLLSQSMLVLLWDCKSSIDMRPDRQVTEFSRGLRAFSSSSRLSSPIQGSKKRRKERRKES